MSRMDELLKRINQLAAKNKAEGLTEAELEERAALRKEYLALFREGFKKDYLENMYYVDDEGNEVKVTEKIGDK